MVDDRWRPLKVRHGGKENEHDALVEGVPPWLRQGLMDWLDQALLLEESDLGNMVPSRDAIRAVEVNVRVEGVDWSGGEHSAHDSLAEKCAADADLFLSVIDFALWVISRTESKEVVQALARLLAAGGSAWAVAPDRRSLVRRVTPEAAEPARRAIDSGSRAGAHIAEAWCHAYGRSPHPSTAYREAVKAVEAAACPVIIPNAGTPTLGKAIAALRDAPDGKFVCVFPGTESGTKPLDAVRGLMDLVWTNQHDRHAATSDTAPLHVSQAEAEAALHAAVTLVQWFEQGAVRLA